MAATETGLQHQGHNRQWHNTGSCHGAAAAANLHPTDPSTAVCCCKQLQQLAAAWPILSKSTKHREMLLCKVGLLQGFRLEANPAFQGLPWQYLGNTSNCMAAAADQQAFKAHSGQTDAAEAHSCHHNVHSRHPYSPGSVRSRGPSAFDTSHKPMQCGTTHPLYLPAHPDPLSLPQQPCYLGPQPNPPQGLQPLIPTPPRQLMHRQSCKSPHLKP